MAICAARSQGNRQVHAGGRGGELLADDQFPDGCGQAGDDAGAGVGSTPMTYGWVCGTIDMAVLDFLPDEVTLLPVDWCRPGWKSLFFGTNPVTSHTAAMRPGPALSSSSHQSGPGQRRPPRSGRVTLRAPHEGGHGCDGSRPGRGGQWQPCQPVPDKLGHTDSRSSSTPRCTPRAEVRGRCLVYPPTEMRV